MSEDWRCFAGVPIGEPLAGQLLEALPVLQDVASAEADHLRWIEPVEWHLTLAFLGPTPIADVPRLIEALRDAAADRAPFSVATGGLGGFPSRRDVRILWYGLADRSRRLAELAIAVRNAMGCETRSPFRGHLTLARARGDRGVTLPKATWTTLMPEGELLIDRVILYRSHLSAGPAQYETLSIARLGEGLAGKRATA